ncbi:MAG: condensation domain-containing protein [Blastocatellia bacterium]
MSEQEKNGLQIAIVGMACRFPGAANVDQFWRNLQGGIESISFFSDEELIASGVSEQLLADAAYVKASAVLDDFDLFDASLFGYHQRDAELMDPQHRIFLECLWESLENAGYNPDLYKGLIGVYAGAAISTYYLANLFDQLTPANSLQLAIANNVEYLTTRASYKLNLSGPSVDVQTACSTSLVAVHLACMSLLSGECDMAIAGGARICIPQKAGHFYQEGGIYSRDGHCRAFDAGASGTVNGNGVGLVVLKRLDDAIADGDFIHAVIKGSAINNDGSAKVGYTAPSLDGQAKAIKAALRTASIRPDTISCIEAHGTGTPLGDPIEIAALRKAFASVTEEKQFCAIGSVKSNIGHLGEAAGVAGLIKTILALRHKQIPPTLHFERPNPHLNLEDSPFYINKTLKQWEANQHPRRAGVSSFGIGGTNAHVIVEEWPEREASDEAKGYQLLTLSARSGVALDSMRGNLADHFKERPDLNIADAAFTLRMGRKNFDYKCMVVCESVENAITALELKEPERAHIEHREAKERPLAFMFPGQGSQYVNMARGLYDLEPTFRKWVDRSTEILKPRLNFDLRQVLYAADGQTAAATQKLRQTLITQPALFVIEFALAQLWKSWGIEPQAMIGHSIGEYVAACIAGVFTFEDALAVVAARGQLMQKAEPGAMLAVSLSDKDVKCLLDNRTSLAAINAPTRCVVSGPIDEIESLSGRLARQGIAFQALETSSGFHSALMKPLHAPFVEQISKVKLSLPKIPFVSNLTGTWITGNQATDAQYWADHLCNPVRFSEGLDEMLKEPERILLEVGPGRSLTGFVRRHPRQTGQQTLLSSLRHVDDAIPDSWFLLNTLGKLWIAGAAVDWSGVYAHQRRRRIPLPTLCFERKHYWVQPRDVRQSHLYQSAASKSEAEISAPLRAEVSGNKISADRFAGATGAGGVLLQQLDLMNRQFDIMARQLSLFNYSEANGQSNPVTGSARLKQSQPERQNGSHHTTKASESLTVSSKERESVPLTPIQRWFFEQGFGEPSHYNISILLLVRKRLEPAMIERAARLLVERHEALRYRFVRTPTGLEQFISESGYPPFFTRYDLAGMAEDQQQQAIEQEATKLQTGLDLWHGPIIRVALFDLSPDKPQRLLLIVHHLVLDIVSKRILVEDLQTIYEHISEGLEIPPAPETTSFKEWARRLSVYAESMALNQEIDYWTAISRNSISPLPVDPGSGQMTNAESSARVVRIELGVEETRSLIFENAKRHQARASEVVLASVAQAISNWTGSPQVLLDIEGHGREPLFESVSLSRTVGWFTVLFPMLLDLRDASDSEQILMHVKNQLRGVPNGGIGYGVLRYLSQSSGSEALRELARAEISFNFVGRFGNAVSSQSLFEPAKQMGGYARSQNENRPYLLDIYANVVDDCLRVEFFYSENIHRKATIERLSVAFVESLRALADSLKERKGDVYA